MGTLKNWIASAATVMALHTTIASAQESPKVADHTAHQVAVVLADAAPAVQSQAALVVATAQAGEADLKKALDTTAKPGQVAVTIVTPTGVTPPALDAASLGAIKVESLSKTVEPTTTLVSPVVSAIATTTKGNGQEVTLKDGSKMSFADVAKLGTKEQDAVIEQVEGAKNRLKLTAFLKEYASNMGQVAIEEGKKIDQGTQVAIEEGKKIDQGTQVAIEEGIELDKKILTTLRGLVDIGKKIDRKYEPLIKQYASNPPPDDNAKYLLEKSQNSQIFA